MYKGQGSLEYLIIIAAVLIVAGVVVLLITNSTGGQKSSYVLNTCKAAASECKLIHLADSANQCVSCDTACTDPTTNQEVFTGAISICKSGRPDLVYQGSPGPTCGDGVCDINENSVSCLADCPRTGDVTPPSQVTGLTSTSVAWNSVTLSWDSATDNVGVTGYNVYRGVIKVGTSATTTYTDSTVSPSTMYSYQVSAYDAAGNEGQKSTALSVTTPQRPLSASTTANPTTGTVPLAVSFTCSALGGASPYTYAWVFGDGGIGSGTPVSHTYQNSGRYASTCTATDSSSPQQTATSSKTITVNSAQCIPNNPCGGDWDCAPAGFCNGLTGRCGCPI